jgi:polysaccharide deacetylase 2 family uncharacterized protein YibQ
MEARVAYATRRRIFDSEEDYEKISNNLQRGYLT